MKIVAVLYPGGAAADNPDLLGCAENALGLRESLGDEHEIVSITEREGEELLGDLRDADVLITTPFWPVYTSPRRCWARRRTSSLS